MRAILGAPPNVNVVTVLPGLTVHEVAYSLASVKGSKYANTFVADATAQQTPSSFGHGSSLEGLIGARTYVIKPPTTPLALAKEMVRSFQKEAAAVGLTPSTVVGGLNAYQLIVAASIVEKEGYYPRNMPQVARVIFNRLARGGPLQMAATVLYFLGLMIGSAGLGEEMERGTAVFLLTRPRSRGNSSRRFAPNTRSTPATKRSRRSSPS